MAKRILELFKKLSSYSDVVASDAIKCGDPRCGHTGASGPDERQMCKMASPVSQAMWPTLQLAFERPSELPLW